VHDLPQGRRRPPQHALAPSGEEGGLSCANCHDPHSGKQTSLASQTETCTKWHQNVRGPKVFEHAPAAEDCTICHNPHGSPNGAQLRNCTNCHSAVNGSHSDPLLKY
jgi:predicted CXXCH cytochrome family protein